MKANSNNPPEFSSLHNLSKTFDIPLNTLRKMASERSFPGIIKLGRSVKVDISVFRQWIQEHRVDNVRGRK